MEYLEYISYLESNNNIRILGNTSKYMICKSRRGPSKPIKLMKELTPKLAYLVGIIYGDGWINSEVNRIGLDKGNYEFLKEVYIPLLFDLFNLNLEIKKAHRSWRVSFKNKIIWDMLVQVFGLRSNKSQTAKVPDAIRRANTNIQKYFLAGLFDTDGGSRQGSFGFTTSSLAFNEEIIRVMNDIGIPLRKDTWFNKKVNKRYYGFVVSKCNCPLILEQIPLKNQKRLLLLDNLCTGAGVAK